MTTTKKSSAVFLVLMSLLILLIISMNPATAVKVENARIALDVEPGSTYSVPVTLSLAPDEQDESFILVAGGFGLSPFDGTYAALDPESDTSPYTARPFITFEKNTADVTAGGSSEVNMTIDVPADAHDGGRYAIISVFRAAALAGQQPEAPVIEIPVFLSIRGGNTTINGEITALEITTIDPGDIIQVATYFQDTGNYHFYGAVNNVTISDIQGRIVAQASTPPAVRVLIPGQEVRFNVTMEATLPDTGYLVTSRIETRDGDLLAEQRENLEGRGIVKETIEPSSPGPANPVVRKAPGFAAGAALLAILLGAKVRKRE